VLASLVAESMRLAVITLPGNSAPPFESRAGLRH